MELKEFKSKYGKLEKKYKLPTFMELNENFEIEKIERESDILLRAVRKVLMEKIMNSLGFIEMLLNPMSAPRMYLPYVKTMSIADKEKIDRTYGALADLVVLSLKQELDYDEKGEAELILSIYGVWKKIKPDFGEVMDGISKPVEVLKKEKSYFG
jgi:hypothetical protein